jgi:hypothetical protein
MTREEQIIKIGAQFAIDETDGQTSGRAASMRGVLLSAFRAGAQWADSYPNWISVDEELPEKGKDVLVWSSGSDEPMVGYYWHWNWQRKQHMFYVYNDRNMWGNITHWMEIQPPRKEE